MLKINNYKARVVCRVLVCFVSHLIICISVERANTVSGDEVLPN